ncbi:MAG: hypothetical protein AB8G05_18655 [Oligoflexales bacterium]
MELKKDHFFNVLLVFSICFFVIGGGGAYLFREIASLAEMEMALSSASRMINGILIAMIAGLSFVLTLTSQLYTPKLALIFLTSPIIMGGFLVIILSNFLIVLSPLFLSHEGLQPIIFGSAFSLAFLGLSLVMPLFVHIIHFLRPDYFLPLLNYKINQGFKKLEKGNTGRSNYINIISKWDIITNIALTAIKRDDRQLIRLATKMLDESLYYLLSRSKTKNQGWRELNAFFIPGLTQEGCEFLKEQLCWPEAYILYKKEQILKTVSVEQKDIIADACTNIHKSIELAVEGNLDQLLELHLMFTNSLMRDSLEKKNIHLFQTFSYHYRINCEILMTKPYHYKEIFASWSYYGRAAVKEGLEFGLETVLYDYGKLLISICAKDILVGFRMLKEEIAPLWLESSKLEGKPNQVSWRVIVKTYWEAKLANYDVVAQYILKNFLMDSNQHWLVFCELSSFNSPLSWELKDRLLSFTYLDPKIIEEASTFFSDHGKKLVG